jgi:hypothetical protein
MLATALVAAGALSCAPLPSFDARCGNGVIDPDEDCDGHDVGSAVCGPPSTAHACRLQCSATKDCPPGWGCGLDGTCRVHDLAGGYRALNATLEVGPYATGLGVADLDRDGRLDVVAQSGYGSVIGYGQDDGIGNGVSFPQPISFGKLGRLDTPGRDYLASYSQAGIGVLQPQSTRAYTPISYSRFRVPVGKTAGDPKFFTMHTPKATRFVAMTRDGVLGIETEKAAAPTLADATSFDNGALDPWNEIVGTPAVGAIDDSTCDTIVIAQDRSLVLRLIRTCDASGNFKQFPMRTIALPAGTFAHGRTFLRDVNGDGHLDLLADVAVGTPDMAPTSKRLLLLFGDGAGTFVGDPASPLQTIEMFKSVGDLPIGDGPEPEIFAIGDLSRKGTLDVVASNGVWRSDGNALNQLFGDTWSAAVIGDFNLTGTPDIIAATYGRIVFENGIDGTNFTRINTLVMTGTRDFEIGDFDGDLIEDVAFISDEQQPSLSILYGKPAGAPEAPLRVATASVPKTVLAASLAPYADDALTDLATVSDLVSVGPSNEIGISILAGEAARVVEAPITLSDATGGEAATRELVFGNFSSDTAELYAYGDICALADEPGGLEHSLWLARMKDSASLTKLTKFPLSSLDPSPGAASQFLTGIDVDGDGLEEAVFALNGYNAQMMPTTRIIAAKFAADTATMSDLASLADGEFLGWMQPVALREGATDLLLQVQGSAGPELRLLRNNGGTFVSIALPQLQGSGGAQFFTAMNVDDDKEREIVAAVPIYVDYGGESTSSSGDAPPPNAGGTVQLFALHVDSTGKPGAWRAIGSIDGGASMTVTALASGDFTRDGVEDLALVNNGTLTIYEGAPKRR